MENNEDQPGNLFARAAAEVGYGDLNATASEKLAEVIRGVVDAGKKGSLTIIIEVKPRGRDSGQIELSGDVKAKIPVKDIAPVMVFATGEGDFQRENPAQRQLPFGKEPTLVKPAANQ